MIPKIKLNELENDLYTIKESKSKNFSMVFVDFQYPGYNSSLGSSSGSPYQQTISPNVFTKYVSLNSLIFQTNNLTIDDIKYEINKEFIKKITELGEQNREFAPKTSPTTSKFDINIEQMKMNIIDSKNVTQSAWISRKIITKILNITNYIAINGRIGPAQWLISNSKTYHYILENLGNVNFLMKNNILNLGNMPYIINELVENDIILLGRKNNIDSPGVHCIILTDDDGYILFNEISYPDKDYTNLTMYCSVVNVGFYPYYQYFKTNTRDIKYYRNMKLQKIKEIYGEYGV